MANKDKANPESEFLAFMSYARSDDRNLDNYISGLREELSKRAGVLLGKNFPIFQDQVDIDIGSDWKELIERGIDQVMFLIVIVTPSFFASTHCREELNRFRIREKNLKRNDLVIPLLIVDTASINHEDVLACDEDAQFIKTRQFADMRYLQKLSLDSEEVRDQIEKIAKTLIKTLGDIWNENITEAKELLRNGVWQKARVMAERAKPICPYPGPKMLVISDNIVKQANICEDILNVCLTAFDSPSLSKRNESIVLAELKEKAQRFEELSKMTLGSNIGVCEEVNIAAKAVTALCRGDYDTALKECDTAPSGRLFNFNGFREQVLLERNASLEIDRLTDVWKNCDWKKICSLIEEIEKRGLSKGHPRAEEFEKRKEVALKWKHALEAVDNEDYKKALHVLNSVSQDDTPYHIEISKKILEIGTGIETSVKAGNRSELDELENNFKEVTTGVNFDQNMYVMGMHEVNYSIYYAQGTICYDQGFFSLAKKYFFQLGDYKDAKKMFIRCDKWIDIIKKLKLRQWDEARSALNTLRQEENNPEVQKWYRWCMWARKVVPVIEQMATGPFVFLPNVHWRRPCCPYEMFAPDLTPTSTVQQCNDFGLDLQSQGGMREEERNAWDAIRNIDKRLAIDFLLFKVSNPNRAASLMGEVSAVEEGHAPGMVEQIAGGQDKGVFPALLNYIVNELGEDGGVFLALQGDYDAAIDFFFRESKARPYDISIFHHLGLAAAAKVQQLEECPGNDEELMTAWEHLIIGWAAVIADDGFWHNWWSDRRQFYQKKITHQQVQKVRLWVQRYYLDQLESLSDIFPGIATIFQVEVNGARAVHAGKGIPLLHHPEKSAVVGPLGTKRLRVDDDLAKWSASFEVTCLEEIGWQQHVFWYFSELAETAALIEDNRCQEAVSALTTLRCDLAKDAEKRCRRKVVSKHHPFIADVSCPCFKEINPAFRRFSTPNLLLNKNACYLLQKAHCIIAQEAVSLFPVRVEKAISHWEIAIELTDYHGSDEDLLSQIRDVVIGRVNTLTEAEGERCLEALNDAVELLQKVSKWDNNEHVLEEALVSALLDRAIHLSNEYDNEKDARLDASRAFSMAPKSLRAIHVLCQASLHHALQLHEEGQTGPAKALLEKVEDDLKIGEELFPGNVDLNRCRNNLQQTHDVMAKRGDPDLTQLLADMRLITGDKTTQQKRNKLTEAMIKETQKEFKGAIKLYSEISQENPANHEAVNRMIYCYRDWIQHLTESDERSPEEVLMVAREAIERFPDSEVLKDIVDELGEVTQKEMKK
jgi:tetratricopeptide (TPR) repeat protein